MNNNVVIIGSGIAGLTCSLYLARAGVNVTVITGDSIGGNTTYASWITNYPGFPDGVAGSVLMANVLAQAECAGAVILIDKVVHIDFATPCKRLVLESGKTLCASHVVIATGRNPRTLNLDGEDRFLGKGIHYCALCDGSFYNKQNIVGVVGGGETAMQDAIYLSNLCCAVHVFIRKDKSRASECTINKVNSITNIHLHYNTVIQSLYGGADDCLEFVYCLDTDTKEVEERRLDALFVAIGYDPCTQLFAGHAGINSSNDGTIFYNGSNNIYVTGSCATGCIDQAIVCAGDGALTAYKVIADLNK